MGAVLRSDPFVNVARGFGNFQEAYFIRGFVVTSDDTAYNGLYSLLPRQYIATELFERVELLRGPSAFLTGINPGGGGIGGAINLLPKRAPNEPLSRVTVGVGSVPGHDSEKLWPSWVSVANGPSPPVEKRTSEAAAAGTR